MFLFPFNNFILALATQDDLQAGAPFQVGHGHGLAIRFGYVLWLRQSSQSQAHGAVGSLQSKLVTGRHCA